MSLLVYGRLVTLAGPRRPRTRGELKELAVLDDGAMTVRDGAIEWVGPRPQARPFEEAGLEVLDARGRLVTPGFVDAHAHPVFASNRAGEFAQRIAGKSYQEIAADGGGILSTVRATRAATEDELVLAGARHAGWMLAGGTTTVEAKSGYGLDLESELKILRAIRRLKSETALDWVPTFLGAHAVPEEHRGNAAGYCRLVESEILDAVVREGLAEYADAFCEERYFGRDDCRSLLRRAKERGLGLRLHADQLTCGGGAELAAELGAKTADHLEQTGPEGIAALAAAAVQPVLLPASVYGLGLDRYPDARAMVEAGLAIVVATDFNPGSSPVPSMPAVLSLACTQMRLSPEEALSAATINAAYSLDRGHDRGSLEPGKRADFVVWDAEDPREIAYWLGAPLVDRVYIGGRRAL